MTKVIDVRASQSEGKRKGVLIVNLGTPKSPHPKDVFHYLNEFLTDARVIDTSWLKRQFLVRGMIVPFRYKKSAEQYHRLWTKEGSPLLFHGKQVQEKLQDALGNHYRVVLAMRYQNPSISEGLEKLRKENIEELLILPLFPQYASATTGSVYQKVMECLKKWNNFPKMVFINHYCDHPELINAFCARAMQYPISTYDHLLLSFHGLPEKQIRRADPTGRCLSIQCCQHLCFDNHFCYKAQCFATARAIAHQLKLNSENYTVCFQSRLGKDPWIQPYLSDVLRDRAKRGDQRLLVLSPSFVCDCLETTCEISFEYDQEFKKMGGQVLQLVEGLNDHPLWIKTLHSLILENLNTYACHV